MSLANNGRYKRQVGRSVLLSLAPEFLGTFFYTFLAGVVTVMSLSASHGGLKLSNGLTVALLDGFVYYALVNLTMKLSYQTSGYLNPALSFALCAVNMASNWSVWHVIRTFACWVMQITGALLGVFAVSALSSTESGAAKLNLGVTALSALGLSIILSTFLTFVILAVRANEGRMSSLVLCFAYTAVRCLAFLAYNGSLNGARALAHAVVPGRWEYVWIDWAGSFLGATIGALCFLVWGKKWRD
jgi:aquaporin-4